MKLVSLLVLCLSVLVAVAAAGQLSAQTTIGSDGTTTTTIGNDTTSTTRTSGTSVPGVSASPATSTAAPVVLNLVEITRMVPAGTTAVTAFTVPPGQMLIVTDVVVTNTGDTPICGAAINRAGAAAGVTTSATTGGTTTATGSMPTATGTTTTGTTATGTTTTGTTSSTTGAMPGTGVQTLAGTITQSDSSITGPLCVAARTSTPLPFTTGIEFGSGQTVQLMNVPDTTTTAGAAATATTPTGSVGFHLRGMLVAA